jgi:hypothetical protein
MLVEHQTQAYIKQLVMGYGVMLNVQNINLS